MTAEDPTGFAFTVERRLYRNVGLDAAGGETSLAWEIASISDRSTALLPGETRRERIVLPMPDLPGQAIRLRAVLAYRRLPTAVPLTMAAAEADVARPR